MAKWKGEKGKYVEGKTQVGIVSKYILLLAPHQRCQGLSLQRNFTSFRPKAIRLRQKGPSPSLWCLKGWTLSRNAFVKVSSWTKSAYAGEQGGIDTKMRAGERFEADWYLARVLWLRAICFGEGASTEEMALNAA